MHCCCQARKSLNFVWLQVCQYSQAERLNLRITLMNTAKINRFDRSIRYQAICGVMIQSLCLTKSLLVVDLLCGKYKRTFVRVAKIS
ncbi:CLUMA_CG018290, isoform A [Clunio marinus]|uniref:CLUMA_CG018290, isoform A n=1 Tax=Clunio marinus TaxID=568069 RepID=A0A1J1IY26_9DIPT|nr:CLUMA_CG018290, isoform A [Clunio marinus]